MIPIKSQISELKDLVFPFGPHSRWYVFSLLECDSSLYQWAFEECDFFIIESHIEGFILDLRRDFEV